MTISIGEKKIDWTIDRKKVLCDPGPHKGDFLEIAISTSSESWINKLSIDVC